MQLLQIESLQLHVQHVPLSILNCPAVAASEAPHRAALEGGARVVGLASHISFLHGTGLPSRMLLVM